MKCAEPNQQTGDYLEQNNRDIGHAGKGADSKIAQHRFRPMVVTGNEEQSGQGRKQFPQSTNHEAHGLRHNPAGVGGGHFPWCQWCGLGTGTGCRNGSTRRRRLLRPGDWAASGFRIAVLRMEPVGDSLFPAPSLKALQTRSCFLRLGPQYLQPGPQYRRNPCCCSWPN